MSSRRNPFDELERMFERMNRQFESAVGGGMGGPAAGSMNVDVADEGEEFVVTADLPGFDKEEIDVRLDGNRLRISAESQSEAEQGDEQYIRRERSHRSMSRSVVLPEDVREDDVSAEYRNGVLTVHLPKVRGDESTGTSIDVR